MSDSSRRLHGLEFFLRSQQRPDTKASGIHARILDDVTHVNLRGNSNDAEFNRGVEKVLGQALPVEPNTVSIRESHIYWLGPDEWLVVSKAADSPGLATRLENTLRNIHSSVNDISGGQVTFTLSGENVERVLNKACTIDFDAGTFKPGHCAQSGLAKASVLIGCIEQSRTFELIVRRSFADYVARWLRHAARHHGIEFR
ncbi:MAG: hypothetical protein O3A13_08450 [Proteobacteria bacterium]|nr:hypothetical protein [Pseudomonadota bacterium]MDA0993649.1 hypothetical protein [Pseudomonadota bacterium]